MTQSTPPPLPSLVGTVLTDGNHSIDNLLAAAWKTLRLNQHLLCAGFSKRHGIEVTETVCVLMVWKWLNVASIAMFCRHALGMFSRAKKDVLYDFLNREDIDWRKFNMDTAKEVYRQQGLGDSRFGCCAETLMTAFDDKVKIFFARSLQSDVFTMRLEFE